MWEVREVLARLLRDGAVVREVPLSYAGEASTYAGELPMPEGDIRPLELLAATPERASFGVVRRRITVAGARSR
ncbi:MAG: hypothetical protein IPF47_15355 [Gemmatimonadetes bacterium]|nr:hypothetical protein [Gemmatimonadota bacterium]